MPQELKVYRFFPKMRAKGITPIVVFAYDKEKAYKLMGELFEENHWSVFDPREWTVLDNAIFPEQYLIIHDYYKGF